MTSPSQLSEHREAEKTPNLIGWLWRGILMGMADMVPGVSGGTMALVTGIYDRLIQALAAFGWPLIRRLLQRQWLGAWRYIDGAFLLTLGAGIALALLAMSHIVHWVLSAAPYALWGVFLGLLTGAVIDLRSQVNWNRSAVVAGLAGIALALLTLAGTAVQLPQVPLAYFIGGAIAITAMLLPGISGSLLLLMMGLYVPVLDAIRQLEWWILGSVAGGCILGVLVFSRLIRWLLAGWHNVTMAALLGVIIGALPRLWPWQNPEAIASGVWLPTWPAEPVALVGGLVSVLAGGAVYVGVTRWSRAHA